MACDQQGCWVTPAEQGYANAGNCSLYYQAACSGGDPYACRAGEVAANRGLLSGITNARLANSLLKNTKQNTCEAANEDMLRKMEAIRIALARAHAGALNAAGATSQNPAMLNRVGDITRFHRDVFSQYGADPSIFGAPHGTVTWAGRAVRSMTGALPQAAARDNAS